MLNIKESTLSGRYACCDLDIRIDWHCAKVQTKLEINHSKVLTDRILFSFPPPQKKNIF